MKPKASKWWILVVPMLIGVAPVQAQEPVLSVKVLLGHGEYVTSAAFSPDGSLIVSASSDMTSRVWDVKSGATLLTLSGHGDVVTSAALSPDGSLIVSASQDKTARVWDAKSGATLLTLSGHSEWLSSASFSPDGGQSSRLPATRPHGCGTLELGQRSQPSRDMATTYGAPRSARMAAKSSLPARTEPHGYGTPRAEQLS